MLKKHMAACLVVTAFAAAPALAQTSTTPSAPTDRPAASGSGTTSTGSPAMQPGASGTTTMSQPSTTMSQSGGMQGQFVTKMEANQMMASDLIGTRVMGANNESIGDINDVIMDRNGQITAAVVGVGGFLGIGEKDVAVPFNALEFMTAQQVQAMNSNNTGNNNVATTGSTATGTTATGTTATGNTAATGTGTAGTTNMTVSNASGNQNKPERVVLRMTKDQLQAAPAFDEDGDNTNNSTTGSAGQSGTSTAPKP